MKIEKKNAKFFLKDFKDHPYLTIQKEIGSSSWFGFSLILKESAPLNRNELVKILTSHQIECRPIVTGNFLKNEEVLKYFDYEVFGEMTNAEYIDKNGLFVGNQQVPIYDQLTELSKALNFSN